MLKRVQHDGFGGLQSYLRGVWLALSPITLSACTQYPGTGDQPVPEAIACAIGKGSAFVEQCTAERGAGNAANEVIIRHEDGAFHRFEVAKDGHGLALADGAGEAKIIKNESMFEITLGNDRYRVPLTMLEPGDAR
jgi:hypothetical protein